MPASVPPAAVTRCRRTARRVPRGDARGDRERRVRLARAVEAASCQRRAERGPRPPDRAEGRAGAVVRRDATPTRDVTRNLGVDDGVAEIAASLEPDHSPAFAHATLHARGGDTQLLVSRKGKATLRRHRRRGSGPRRSQRTTSTRADVDRAGVGVDASRRTTARARAGLPLDLPFLDRARPHRREHRLVPAMARKWRQIDKFLEVLDHALDALPARRAANGARRSASSTTAPARAT